MTKFFSFIFIIFFLISCQESTQENSPSTTNGLYNTPIGTRYQFHKQNPNGNTPKKGDLIDFHLVITDHNGKTTRNTYNEKPSGIKELPFEDPYFIANKHYREIFSLVKENDSLTFWINTNVLIEENNLKNIPKDKEYKYTIKIQKIRNRGQIRNENDIKLKAQRKQDSLKIAKYLVQFNKNESQQYQIKDTNSGLKYCLLKEGTGKNITPNDTIKLQYTGKLLDGQVCDQSDGIAEYVANNIIPKGLEEGVGLMREGAKGLFILPSDLAFGADGMQNIIPPYSVLIYEVDVLKVNRK
jgi:FKBP-type peptidyl-prolyl cis-trans isomerase FkpA